MFLFNSQLSVLCLKSNVLINGKIQIVLVLIKLIIFQNLKNIRGRKKAELLNVN